jgi:hypothetical protein
MNRVAAMAVAGVLLLSATGRADVKVKAEYDKAFDFSTLKTWGWNDQGPGKVIMARTADDDPEVVRKRAEPVIKDAVAAEMPGRGIQAAAPGSAPDLEVMYYVLITVGTQSQQIGQFLPSVAEWGLPPISGATQSYKVIEQGSLVLDISANNRVIWRGMGQAELKPGQAQEKRQTLLRAAVRDVLKRFPPKK